MKKIHHNYKGVTLVALTITILTLIILAGVSIAALSGENGILKKAQNAQNETEKATEKEQISLACSKAAAINKYGKIMAEELQKQLGKIGIIITDEKITQDDVTENITLEMPSGNKYIIMQNGIIKEFELGSEENPPVEDPPLEEEPPVEENHIKVNEPILKQGMQAITFSSTGEPINVSNEDIERNNWYNYEAQTTATNTYNEETGEWGTSHWANAMLDGNYYVWIPRYAYKIDRSITYTTQDGGTSNKIDVQFIDKTINSENVETEVGEGYIVHPAFTFGEDALSGIWVGKYESSNDGNGNVKIIPNVTAYTGINVAAMFSKAQALSKANASNETVLDAHMIKNIEWGAVAYLAHSQYGRNGTEISVNQCTGQITGAGRGIGTGVDYPTYNYSYDINSIQASQLYNGKIGKLSSTTGNVYGVYDISGGAWEYVMGFYGTAENTPSLASTGFTSAPARKYYDLYINKLSVDNSNIGDALYETNGWFTDNALFLDSSNPIFVRGGSHSDMGLSGPFFFGRFFGMEYPMNGFRVCIAVNE